MAGSWHSVGEKPLQVPCDPPATATPGHGKKNPMYMPWRTFFGEGGCGSGAGETTRVNFHVISTVIIFYIIVII